MPERLFLGVDGGGTKTASVIIDLTGCIVSEGLGGPANSFHNPPHIVEQSVRDSIDAALAGSPGPIARAACHLPTREGIQILEERIAPVLVDHVGERDVALAAAGMETESGIVIIAGTGSSVQGRAPDGRRMSVGGYGSLLGDEGGAYDIALRGIKRALRTFDGREPPCRLADHLESYFGPFSTTAFPLSGEIARSPREKLAGFALRVSQAAAEGDAWAANILREAGESLASDAVFVASHLYDRNEEFAVVLSGGVFNAGASLITPLARRIGQDFPGAAVRTTEVSPAVGAARIARARFEQEREK